MKTIYAVCEPGKVVLKEKELPAPGLGQVLLKAKYSAMSPMDYKKNRYKDS